MLNPRMGQPTKRIPSLDEHDEVPNAAILTTRSRSGWQQRRISMVLGHHQAVRSSQSELLLYLYVILDIFSRYVVG